MAIQSMTGFGRAAVEVAGVPYVVEVRSVNHRFLDLKVRLPRGLESLEPALRQRLGERLKRGRIDFTVSVLGGEELVPSEVVVNEALAQALITAHRRLAALCGRGDEAPSMAALSAFPGVLKASVGAQDSASLHQAILGATDEALSHLTEMRAREGESLALELVGLLNEVSRLRLACAQSAPAQTEAYGRRLFAKLKETLAELGAHVDPARVAHEVALFADRTDITEELARLDFHVSQFNGWLAEGSPEGVGRRLDFLCQEMFREANTTGSKSQDVALSRLVIELKACLERLREQVQNVE